MRVVVPTSILLCVCFATVGCGKNGLPLVPVRGKITFNGGPPPAVGTVSFTPISVDPGLPNRPGRAAFDKEGNFQVTSFKENDGLIPGKYHPQVSCWMGAPSSNDPSSFDRLNYVPKTFQPEPIVVNASDGPVEIVINVPKKK
jgi:hypothetical protein